MSESTRVMNLNGNLNSSFFSRKQSEIAPKHYMPIAIDYNQSSITNKFRTKASKHIQAPLTQLPEATRAELVKNITTKISQFEHDRKLNNRSIQQVRNRPIEQMNKTLQFSSSVAQ